MKQSVEIRIIEALKALGIEEIPRIEVEIPREESFGDLSSPVAMALARTLKRPPREIARDIAEKILAEGVFDKVEVAGPGFINFTMGRDFYYSSLKSLLKEGGRLLRRDIGGGRKVQIEYVSANPTGPLHLGHGRGAAVGGALANLLQAAGYDVTREYYVNDKGNQAYMLGLSVYERYRELLGYDTSFPEDGYQGQYIYDIARAFIREKGDIHKGKDLAFADVGAEFINFSLQMMLDAIKANLENFGIRFDTWQSERDLYTDGDVDRALEFLKERGLIYESEGAQWFRAMEFGDDKDRVLIKSNGEHTYFMSDIAYHEKKVLAGFDEIINVWGADHHGYIPRLEAVLDALGYGREKLRVVLVQMVSLQRGGKPVQMSKRAGKFVTLDEVIEEVGADTTKFIFLTRRPDSHLTFDLELAKAASAENPVYYVQYANARVNSIFAHATERGIGTEGLEDADLSVLSTDDDIRLIRKMLTYPMVFEAAAHSREPHRITFFLQELAGMFHPYYNKHRVVTDDEELTRARLALMSAVRMVLGEGLGILGITAPDRM